MGRIKLKIHYKRVVDSVEFLEADRIDRTRLAEAMETTTANVSLWITTGKVPEKYLPKLRTIDMESVLTLRKKYDRKNKDKRDME